MDIQAMMQKAQEAQQRLQQQMNELRVEATAGLAERPEGLEEEFNARCEWGVGSALSFVVLAISALMVWLSIKISKVERLQA